jgi:hypothetical protein
VLRWAHAACSVESLERVKGMLHARIFAGAPSEILRNRE